MATQSDAVEWSKREFNHVSPDTPLETPWWINPVFQRPAQPTPSVIPNILHFIGNTPLVKLNKIPQSEGIECDMYAKCEFFNPGGSVKDRIAYRMVLDAEEKGLIKPGYTLIEPTSGNTGIGIALASAVRGYRCIIVMPEKMSNEKVDTLKALGAEIIRTPTEAAFDDPNSHFGVCYRLNKEIPNSIILDQYRNPSNPLAHYDGTGTEILDAFDNKVDMIVIGAGTGGTVAGIGRKVKDRCPSCKVIGADPEGSILALPESLNKSDVQFYEIEGIGYDFVPSILDRSVVDEWYKSNDVEGLPMSRRLIKEEGLLCGGSSGFALAVALKAAKKLKKGDKCVVLLPDGMRNYMTKFISDNWMEARNFKEVPQLDHWWWNNKISNIHFPTPITLLPTLTCDEAIKQFSLHNVDQLPVVDSDGNIKGMVTKTHLMNRIIAKKALLTDPVTNALFQLYRKLDYQKTLGLASRILEKEQFVLITKEVNGKASVLGVMTSQHLLEYITNTSPTTNGSLQNGNSH